MQKLTEKDVFAVFIGRPVNRENLDQIGRINHRFSMLSVFMLIALLFTSVVLDVNAHSGKTDSSGGHTDHSTGEYHYHHGYSAHEHYDMDGDGKKDCPYNFDDQTDHGSKSSQSSKESVNSEPKKDYTPVFVGILSVGLYVFFMFVLPFLLTR